MWSEISKECAERGHIWSRYYLDGCSVPPARKCSKCHKVQVRYENKWSTAIETEYERRKAFLDMKKECITCDILIDGPEKFGDWNIFTIPDAPPGKDRERRWICKDCRAIADQMEVYRFWPEYLTQIRNLRKLYDLVGIKPRRES